VQDVQLYHLARRAELSRKLKKARRLMREQRRRNADGNTDEENDIIEHIFT
jgi:hypothetical protein